MWEQETSRRPSSEPDVRCYGGSGSLGFLIGGRHREDTVIRRILNVRPVLRLLKTKRPEADDAEIDRPAAASPALRRCRFAQRTVCSRQDMRSSGSDDRRIVKRLQCVRNLEQIGRAHV